MNALKAVKDYLSALPGLEALSLEGLGTYAGAAALSPAPAEPVTRTYLDGSSMRRERYYLWRRRGFGGGAEARNQDLRFLSDLADTLEARTRQGNLPQLGSGARAWSLRATQTPVPEVIQEDGLLVDQLALEFTYFMEG